MATVYIPSLMRNLTGGQEKVEVPGSTVRQIIDNLDSTYPSMKDRLVQNNRIKRHIAVAVDGQVTPLGLLEKVGEDSEVHFLTSVSGG